MNESAIYLEPISQAQARLERLITERQAHDPLAPVTVIAPSRYAALFLRRNIGQHGRANVRFMEMPDLAALLGGTAVAAHGLPPLKPMIEYEAVRIAASEASGSLAPFRENRSFHDTLQATFREFRGARTDTLDKLAESGGLSSQIVELYKAFLDHTKGYYTSEDIVAAAAEYVRGGHAPMLSELGSVIVYLPYNFSLGEEQLLDHPRLPPTAVAYNFSLGEGQLLDALMSTQSCALVLGVTGDEEADAAVHRIAASFSCPVHREPEARPPLDTESRLSIASDAREEIRSIARDIAVDARRGIPFHRMAVLYWQREPYASLIAEQFALAGVPISGPPAQPLHATTIGRVLDGIVALVDGDLSRDDVMRWLTSCPIKYGRRRFSASRWDAISRDAGVVKGLDQWRNRLDRYANRMKRSSQAADDDVSEERKQRMARDAEEARALREFIIKLHADLATPENGRSWTEFADWARGLLDEYLNTSALPESERDNLEKIQANIDELKDLDRLGGSRPDIGDFRAVLGKAMSARSARTSELGDGVFVSSVDSSIGMRFDKVYFVGMVEGQVPPRVGGDPLLPERVREQAGLPLPHDPAEERYKYLAAAAGQARVLSFPRSGNASQHPSRWFLEEATRRHGSRVSSTALASMTSEPWLNVIASAEDAIQTIARAQPADLHDYDMHKLWLWLQRGNPLGQHHLVAYSSILSNAMQMERTRARSRKLTIWDGDLSTVEVQTRKEPVSATRLEMWATCPYRYFLSYELKITAPEQPEEPTSITPLNRGFLVHAILERFISETLAGGTVPEPSEPWDEVHRRQLDAVADQEFRDAERRGDTGKALLWEIARAEIRRDLHTFLDADSNMRKTHGVSPRPVERSFGMSKAVDQQQNYSPGEWAEISFGMSDSELTRLKRNGLRYRGVIDRLDVSPDGKTALVLDYKTGGTGGYENMSNDPVRRGTRMQLPVYALAAQEIAERRGIPVEDVKAAYWFVSSRGGFVTRPSKPVHLNEMLEPFDNVVETFKAGVHDGLFPANPGMSRSTPTENCAHCDFDKICPPRSRRWRTWDRKRKNDHRLADYVSMAVGGSVEDGQ